MSIIAAIGSRPPTLGHGGGTPVVTSVTLWYNGQDVSTYNGLLLFTGSTYALIAKDQHGNTLSNGSGTWASTDATNAPIDSSGIVSPNANVAGGSVTFTHAASGKVGTALLSVLKTPAAIYKQRGTPANTTALMAQISSGLGTDSSYNSGLPVPTGGGGSLYSDGLDVNHFFIDSTTPGRQLMGTPGMVNILPTTGNTGEMLTRSGGFQRAWGYQVIRFDPPFTLHGQGGGSQAFKLGNWYNFPLGRVGPEITNGNGTSGQIENYCANVSPDGGSPSPVGVGDTTTELTAGETWVSITLYESRGGNIMSSRWAWFKIGSVPSTPFGGVTVEGPMAGVASRSGAPPTPFQYQPTTVNYNQAPPFSDLFVTIFDWMLVDGDTYGDPFGVTGTNSTPTLTGISGGTVAPGDTADSIVLTGTNFNANCQPLFSNSGIYPQTITINSSTQMTVVVAVDASASTGAGTVTVNNQASQQTSGTQAVTVSGGSTPTLTSATPNSELQGATSQNIALVGTNFVSGQTAVFSNAGITVNSTTVNSSTSITANITVSGSATPGAGTVKVHDATNGDSNTKPFTVASSSSATLVQSNSVYPGTSAAFGSNNTAGNLLVAALSWIPSGMGETPTLTDSQGNTWTPMTIVALSLDVNLRVFYTANCAAGANTVTAGGTGTGSDFGISIFEVLGIVTSSPVDATTSANPGTSTTTPGVTGLVLSQTDFVMGFYASENNAQSSITAGSGYTIAQTQLAHIDAQEYQAGVAAGTVSVNMTLSTSDDRWVFQAVAFKQL